MQIDMMASGTFTLDVLDRSGVPHNNAQLENHPWFYLAGEFRRANGVTTISTYHLVVATLDESAADTILAIATDDVVKILACKKCGTSLGHGRIDRTYVPGGTKQRWHWDILSQVIYH
jgi:hypothetical protein